jgi:hypothetical protein
MVLTNVNKMKLCFNLCVAPCRGALFFLLDQKEQKNQVSRKASLPHMALTLQIRQNLGLQTIALLRSLEALASANICYALPNAQATIVLPDFARSYSTDRKKEEKSAL